MSQKSSLILIGAAKIQFFIKRNPNSCYSTCSLVLQRIFVLKAKKTNNVLRTHNSMVTYSTSMISNKFFWIFNFTFVTFLFKVLVVFFHHMKKNGSKAWLQFWEGNLANNFHLFEQILRAIKSFCSWEQKSPMWEIFRYFWRVFDFNCFSVNDWTNWDFRSLYFFFNILTLIDSV